MRKFFGRKSLYFVLITPFVALIALSSGIVGGISFYKSRQAVNDLTEHLQYEVSSRIQERLRSFLGVPRDIVRSNASSISRGFPSATDVDALERTFMERVRIYDELTSIYFGNTSGGLVNSGREPDTDRRYVIRTEGFAAGVLEKYAIDTRGNPTELLARVPSFDARTRLWYARAAERGDTTWSPIYILTTGQDMAIACSHPVYDTDNTLLGVISADIFLSHISRFLQGLKIGDNGQCFIFERSGLLVASSSGLKPFIETDGAERYRRIHLSESSSPVIREAATVLKESFSDYHGMGTPQHLSFSMEGKRKLFEVLPFSGEGNPDWLVGIVISEADFMTKVDDNSRYTILLMAATLLATILSGLAIAGLVTRPILRLHRSALVMAKGDWPPTLDSQHPVSEVEELTGAFNHMAAQLRNTLESLSREVAERSLAESRLRESEERWQFALEGAGDGVWDWNVEIGEVLYSRQWKAMLGFDEHEIGNALSEWDQRLHPDDRNHAYEEIGKHFSGVTDVYVSEHRLRCKDETYKWILDRGKVVRRSDDGRPLRVVGTHTDISERKRVEEERMDFHRRLQQIEKAESLTRMAGAIAHNFNNILGAVIGNLEMVLDDLPSGSDSHTCVAEALKASWQAADISRFMLTYLGQVTVRHEPLDLTQAIEETAAILHASIPGNVHLKMKLPSGGPVIRADMAHVEQILTNLVSNAVEAIGKDEGQVTVTVETVPAKRIPESILLPVGWKPTKDYYALLTVSDTGSGLDAANVEKIFDPFFTTRFTGRGLGLPVVMGLVRSYKGAVTVESRPGEGAVFRVYFPAEEHKEIHPVEASPAFQSSEDGGLVLVVDDEPSILDMAVSMLRRLGYDAVPASDGSKALEIFSERKDAVRLAILDLSMPEMDGFETLEALRALRSDIPVIICSGYEEEQAEPWGSTERPQAFLHKPFGLEALKRALAACQERI